MSRHRQRRGFKPRSLYLWHRYLGLSAAILVVILAISGIVLNHADELDLDGRYVRSDLLLDWYGIEADTPVSFHAVDRWVSLSGGSLYIDANVTEYSGQALHGVVGDANLLGVALDDALLLMNHQGQLIEKLDQTSGLPHMPRAVGSALSGRWVVRGDDFIAVADEQLAQWQSVTDVAGVQWSVAEQAPEQLTEQVRAYARYRILPWERVLLDLHSGRLFGSAGVWVMDAAALVMLLLAVSGTWIWVRQRRKSRKHSTA